MDAETIRFLKMSARPEHQVRLVEAYMKEQGLFRRRCARRRLPDTLSRDLGSVEASIAGPRRPQDRVLLREGQQQCAAALPALLEAAKGGAGGTNAQAACTLEGKEHTLGHGAVVIASITSCTNTSNPSVMIAGRPWPRRRLSAA